MPEQQVSQSRLRAQLRLKPSRAPRSRLRRWLGGSLAAHLLALALVIFVRLEARPAPPPEEPAFGMVFEPSPTHTKGAPNPSKITQTPQGDDQKPMHSTPSPQVSPRITPAVPPPSSQAPPSPAPPSPAPPSPAPPSQAAPPEVNLLPPEYQQAPEPPPPQQQAEEALPQRQSQKRQRSAQARPRSQSQPQSSRNPFANPMQFSYAPQARSGPSGGLRHSRSLDLSMGPMVEGGRVRDAVAHVVGPGGAADYLELLSEFVEEHKYYPPSAATNGEQGSAVVQVTILRDGTLRSMRLVSSSGSSLLDAAWQAVFRDNRMPAFPDDLTGPQRTFTLTLNYELMYH